MKLGVIIIVLEMLIPLQVNATVTASQDQSQICDYFISEKITLADLKVVNQITASQLSKRGGYTQYTFCLDSKGGDLEAAIAIGREFRRMNAGVFISQQSQCYSSCVFILAGAVDRTVLGAVGIHRPYALSTNAEDYASAQTKYKRMVMLSKSYLSEMNLPEQLFDAMNAIPPESLKVLSKNELQQYGLNQEDPVSAELTSALQARKYGINKSELLSRRAKSEQVCKRYLASKESVGYYQGCVDSVMRGEK